MLALIILILAAMVLWAIVPPVAVGLVLLVGGAYLVVLGLCRVSSDADRHAETYSERFRRETGGLSHPTQITAITTVSLVDEAYDLNDKEMLRRLGEMPEPGAAVDTWTTADDLALRRHVEEGEES